jgi:endo-1,4-beta-xylanase
MKSMFLLLFLYTPLLACQGNHILPYELPDRHLRDAVNFPIGFAANPSLLAENPAYASLAESQFSSLTPENLFKPYSLHPTPDSFDWAAADELAAYAASHDQRLHGHALIWHNQLPDWMEEFEGEPAAWDSMMKVHIQTIVGHFKGQVQGWDVVNEAVEDDGSLRETIWYKHLGKEYLAKAFRYAHEADPEAVLFYNDYNLSTDSVKRATAKEWLDELRAEGVPIHGIGMQMHISQQAEENDQIARAMQEFSTSGYQIHLSEIDISVNKEGKKLTKVSKKLLRQQAKKLAFVRQTYQQLPAEQQYGMTFWGIGDGDSWIRDFFKRDDYPLLFDDAYQPKAAYYAMWE